MKISKWAILITALLLMTLPFLAACGDDETEEPTKPPQTTEPTKTTEPPKQPINIKIGNITDKSGPASQALVNVDQALKDNLKYFKEEGLFPEGVTIELIEYDTQYDPAKFVTGYEYLKEKGADIIVSSVPGSGEVLKSRVDDDNMIFFMLMATPPLYTPPGYIFSVNINSEAIMYTLLDWIKENDPNFPTDRPAKLGGLGMKDPYVEGWIKGLQSYCRNNAEWELEETYVIDWTTVTFGSQVDGLKDCDYIIPPTTGMAVPNFMKEYREAGYDATFLGNDAHMAYYGLLIDGAGWDVMDGMYFCLPYTWYSDDAEVIDILDYVFANYHTEAEVGTLKWSGGAYRGGFTQWRGMLLLLKGFLEETGVVEYDSEAFYQYLQQASIEIDGNTWDYSPTDRQSWNSMGMLQADADVEATIRVDDGWFPVVFEP